MVRIYETGENYNNVAVLGTNFVVEQPTQNCYNIPRKAQVEACKTDAHRYCELEMKTGPRKTKKYNYIEN